MATEDQTVKITEAHTPDGHLTKATEEHRPGKTSWDKASVIIQGLGSLGILVSIATLIVGVYQFNTQQSASAQMQATQVAVNRAQALDQQEQATLETYFDRMSDLLLQHGLATSKPSDPVRAIGEAQTLTALRNVDGNRRGTLIRFLWKAQLVTGQHPIIPLNTAYIAFANLSNAYLDIINLSQALLTGANFYNSDLHQADLHGADLRGANLSDANLSCYRVSGKDYCADLSGANLGCYRVSGKDYCADLRGADLSGADLKGATGITITQLEKQTKTLKGAIMPDGSIHP